MSNDDEEGKGCRITSVEADTENQARVSKDADTNKNRNYFPAIIQILNTVLL